jgi:serine kinase of HPr protein (carbohydrate metabolism regulator)
MFNNSILIEISGLKERTFYRYLNDLKKQGVIEKIGKFYFDETKALIIAEKMGFKSKFEKHLKKINA